MLTGSEGDTFADGRGFRKKFGVLRHLAHPCLLEDCCRKARCVLKKMSHFGGLFLWDACCPMVLGANFLGPLLPVFGCSGWARLLVLAMLG